jgi:hypothetical protein
VSERTIYRHMANEQELHRAVMRCLQEEAGLLTPDVTARISASGLSFSASVMAQPPFVEQDRRRSQALLAALLALTGDWSDTEREMAAAVLEIIWAIPLYERLISAGNLAPLDAAGRHPGGHLGYGPGLGRPSRMVIGRRARPIKKTTPSA